MTLCRPSRVPGVESARAAAAENPLAAAVLPRFPLSVRAAPSFGSGVIDCRMTGALDADALKAGDIERAMHALSRGHEMWRMACIGRSDGVVFEHFDYLKRYCGRKRQLPARDIYALEHAPREKGKGLIMVAVSPYN